ncbi:hypothetical protein [Butyricicoccus pullicaecorum]|uniref:Uncharacterized protein n=1 Tax=Butyricicoccus pullicaecorum TaxID=501571 RepID=A0A1Y4LFN6_9FIRM|nr:hypothetical protein [Butyricicoccus pullicaecorum]OUP55517.1 hypothetical protein B5F15_14675 [Butyricicoccus pullicaecorum]
MAKTIKFNLICDEQPIRTIEDLQHNFCIEDVLAYYNNQLLHRWLKVRGYTQELESVSNITSTQPIEIIKNLIQIFNVTGDEAKIEESIYMLQYLQERKELCSLYEQENYNTTHIIEDYQAGYDQLVNKILENPDDVALIKSAIQEIVTNYAWILELNHRSLFYTLQDNSILAIMCLLMNDKCRNYYLPIKKEEDDGTITLDIEKNTDKKTMFRHIQSIIQRTDFSSILGKNLISFSGVTDGYWKDLEPKGKKYMIISIASGDYVRSAGVSGGDLSYADIFEKFVIVDGIDYKSNTETHKLCYMEV